MARVERTKIECEICGIIYRKCDKKQHMKLKKHKEKEKDIEPIEIEEKEIEKQYKCIRCHKYKEIYKYGTDKKGEKRKVCKECYKENKQFRQKKTEFEYIEDGTWKEHPKYKKYVCNTEGYVVNTKTKKIIGKINDEGYVNLKLRTPEIIKMSAHRFVCETWIGPIPEKMVVDHINRIKSDNRLENLKIVTQSDNCKKKIISDGIKWKPRKCKGINQQTQEEIEYKSMREASKETGCSEVMIQKICHGFWEEITTSKTTNIGWWFEFVN